MVRCRVYREVTGMEGKVREGEVERYVRSMFIQSMGMYEAGIYGSKVEKMAVETPASTCQGVSPCTLLDVQVTYIHI
jgi:hypothetical protein